MKSVMRHIPDWQAKVTATKATMAEGQTISAAAQLFTALAKAVQNSRKDS